VTERRTHKGYALTWTTEGMATTSGDPRPLLAVLGGNESLIGDAFDWQNRAICAETSPELYYPEKGANADVADVKAVCFRCPVRRECLTDALCHMDYRGSGQFGIWGGTCQDEREHLLSDFGGDVTAAVNSAMQDTPATQPRKVAA
jgi:WhiB family redox-sensing transcriptional regulator